MVGGFDAVLKGASKNPSPVDCPRYRYPDDPTLVPGAKQVPYVGVPPGNPTANAILVQDARTGQITWNAPARIGFYNIAFVVEEWRRTALGKRMIGYVVRDMQIIVTATTNLPPTLTVPPDVCVVAGTPVELTISATDGVATGALAPTPVTLTAYSGIIPPATFTQTLRRPPPLPRRALSAGRPIAATWLRSRISWCLRPRTARRPRRAPRF